MFLVRSAFTSDSGMQGPSVKFERQLFSFDVNTNSFVVYHCHCEYYSCCLSMMVFPPGMVEIRDAHCQVTNGIQMVLVLSLSLMVLAFWLFCAA